MCIKARSSALATRLISLAGMNRLWGVSLRDNGGSLSFSARPPNQVACPTNSQKRRTLVLEKHQKSRHTGSLTAVGVRLDAQCEATHNVCGISYRTTLSGSAAGTLRACRSQAGKLRWMGTGVTDGASVGSTSDAHRVGLWALKSLGLVSREIQCKVAGADKYRRLTMYGNFLSRSVRGVTRMLQRPDHGARWVRDRISKATPLDLGLPWFSWPAIEYLDRLPLAGARVFEYGGGGSTLYFLKRGCHVRTAENSPTWAELVSRRARAAGYEHRLDLRVVDMPEHPTASDHSLIEHYVMQIEADERWDLVVVDGVDGTPSTRMRCLARARAELKQEGTIVLDDAWRNEYSQAPEILRGFSPVRCVGLGPARWGVTRTDVYRRL